MQFRIPKWYLLVLLCALQASTSRAASVHSPNHEDDSDTDSDDTDDDDDDDDHNSTKGHHTTSTRGGGATASTLTIGGASPTGGGADGSGTGINSTGTLTKHRVSGGSITGIILACLLLLLLLILTARWCVRKRRAQRDEAAVRAAPAVAPAMKDTSKAPLLTQAQHPPSALQPRSVVRSPSDSIPGELFFSESTGRQGTLEMRNVAPSTDDSIPLPNPYDSGNPPQPPPRDDVDLLSSPISPTSDASMARYTSYRSSSSYRYHDRSSTAPSAWTQDESAVALLARGGSQASRLTTTSSLHEELSGYQKALEAHHRKEEEDAVRQHGMVGEGSALPADPPPVYTASHEL